MKWLFLISTFGLLSSSLLLSGCGDDSSGDACVYGVQQNLDQGSYDAVIATLENNGTCGGSMTSNQAWLNLSAAYMGKAGLTMSNLLGAVVDSNDSSAMSSFMTSFSASATADGLANLDLATTTYAYIATTTECATTQTGEKAEACLYSGLTSLTKAIGSLSALLGSDTLALISSTVTTGSASDVNSNGTADGLDVTVCAIANASVVGDATCTTDGNVTFTSATGVTFTNSATSFSDVYVPRTFTVAQSGQTTYSHTAEVKLIDQGAAIPTPVTTSGLCTSAFVTCSDLNVSDGCYPCPVVATGSSSATTVTSGLLDIINTGGLNTLSTFLPEESNGTDSNITSYLIDSIEGSTGDNNITEAELATFLQTLS